MSDLIFFFEKVWPFKNRIFDDIQGLFLACVLHTILCWTSITIYGFSYFIVGSYFSLFILLIALYIDATKCYISYLLINENCVTIKYSIYNREYSLEGIPIKQIKFSLATTWYSRWPYYRLEVYFNNKKILIQRRGGDWTEEKFKNVIEVYKNQLKKDSVR